jgi:hypothetical protein
MHVVSDTVVQLGPANPVTASVERAFAHHVAERLNGRILRYSQRLEFLNAADRLRINRFRANLIIAMVQHQTTGIAASEPSKTPTKFSRHGPIIAAVCVIEIAMIAGVWWMCHW